MFTLLDRQLIRSFFKAYLVCMVSLLGMYVVIDLFMNLDDFTRDGGFAESLRVHRHVLRLQGDPDLRPALRGDRPFGRHVHDRLDAAQQ